MKKQKKNTRDYHKVRHYADGGEVNRMTQEERREYGKGILRERMTRTPDTDEMTDMDRRVRDDGPTAKELQRSSGERVTLWGLRQAVKDMDKKLERPMSAGEDYGINRVGKKI